MASKRDEIWNKEKAEIENIKRTKEKLERSEIFHDSQPRGEVATRRLRCLIRDSVTADDIANVVFRSPGIPVKLEKSKS